MASRTRLQLLGETREGKRPLSVAVGELVLGGWSGRDRDSVEAHIRELEALGVRRPDRTPIFYRVSHALLTTADEIQVCGETTSGEVEWVIFGRDDGLWVGLGSDQTDRTAEATTNVTLSKQLCAKVVGPVLWPLAEVASHWDRLVLRSFAIRGGERRPYQESAVAAMRDPREMMALYLGKAGATLPEGMALFSGTIPVKGGIAPADGFAMELEDPVLGRTIRHAYAIRTLPIAG